MTAGGLEIVALIAVGMGGAVWATDRENPSSRALATFLVLTGLAVVANVLAGPYYTARPMPWWVRGVGFVECSAFLAATQWGIRVGETVLQREGERRRGALLIRIAQGLSLLYAVLAAAFPALRARALVNAFEGGSAPDLAFYLFATPPVAAGLIVFVAGFRVLRGRPDRAEAVRILAMLAAMPLLTTAVVLPDTIAPVALALGEIVFLVGVMRYHVIQGARGQFMSRFLAPQVAEMVRNRGLRNAMSRQRLTVTVVSCDIRGFTAFAQDNTPERVMRLLRDFYAAIGFCVERAGGTIKDLAGDGALILVGAPIPYDDSAARALGLAGKLQVRARRVVRRYSEDLGFGVGVATGEVAVGIVGQGARFEYIAVGPAVNLAARLCDKAADGEIRVDAETLTAAGRELPKKSELRKLKGVGRQVPTYVISTLEN